MKNKLLVLLLAMVLFTLTDKTYAQNSDLEITYRQNNDNTVDFNFVKNVPGCFWVVINFNSLSNTNQSTYRGYVEGISGKVLTLKPKKPNQGIGFSFSYQYHRGKALRRIKNDIVYLLPFKNNIKARVNNIAYLGKSIGEGAPDSWAAFQFMTEKEEVVLAARKGLVVKIIDNFICDTTQKYQFTDKVNEVLIEHKDGTLARYSGFKRGSIKVTEGQYVFPQDELGLLGKYDSSAGYKLRFCIYYLNTPFIDYLNTKEKEMNRFTYVNPRFHWKGGESIILPRNDYVAEATEELIMQEFSRREKKKYQKRQLN